MSNISISLAANTSQYVQRIRSARTETDRNIIRMEQRIDKFATNVGKDFTSVNGAINAMMNGVRTIKFGGYAVAGAAAIATSASIMNSFHQVGQAAVENAKLIQNAARQARVSIEDMATIGNVVGTAGISIEQFGDQAKDLQDKLGDYLTTGGGAFTDFFDAIRGGSKMTVRDLQGLSAIELFQTVHNEMTKVGATSEQMTLVFESLANDSSKMIHLFKDGGKEYERLSAKMKREKLVLLGSTMEEIQGLDVSMQAAASNMEVYFSERFVNMTKMLNEFGHDFSNWLNDSGKNYQIKNTIEAVNDGSFALSSLTTAKEVEAHIARLKAANDAVYKEFENTTGKNKGSTFNGNAASIAALDRDEKAISEKKAKIDKAITDAQKKLELLSAQEASKGTANIEGDGEAAKLAQLDARAKAQEKIITDSLKRQSDAEKAAADARKKQQEATSKADKDHYDALAKQLELNAKNEATTQKVSKSNIEKINKDKIDIETKAEKERLANKTKYATDSIEKAKAANNQELLDLKLAKDKGEITEAEYAADVIATNKRLADTLKDISKTKLNETRAAEDKRLQAQLQYAVGGNAKLEAQYQIDVTNLNRALSSKLISQETYNAFMAQLNDEFAKNEAAQEHKKAMDKLNIQSQFATTNAERRRIEHETALQELEQYRNAEGVTEQMYLDKQAELQRNYDLAEFEAKSLKYLTEQEADVARNEMKLELLREQLEAEAITKEEFIEREKETQYALAEAKDQLRLADISSVENQFGELSESLKEGSKAQKAAFAVEKAATMGRLSLRMADAWSNVDTDPTYITDMQRMIAKGVVVAQYGSQIAMAGAAAIGQFHNGGEVDQTGSYILKAGERVVAPDTNKELKNFLKTSDSASGAVQVDAPLTIQGDTTISDQKLLSMLATQREQIAKLVSMAQRENPRLR